MGFLDYLLVSIKRPPWNPLKPHQLNKNTLKHQLLNSPSLITKLPLSLTSSSSESGRPLMSKSTTSPSPITCRSKASIQSTCPTAQDATKKSVSARPSAQSLRDLSTQ